MSMVGGQLFFDTTVHCRLRRGGSDFVLFSLASLFGVRLRTRFKMTGCLFLARVIVERVYWMIHLNIVWLARCSVEFYCVRLLILIHVASPIVLDFVGLNMKHV